MGEGWHHIGRTSSGDERSLTVVEGADPYGGANLCKLVEVDT